MSAFGPKRTQASALYMSAFGGNADIAFSGIRFRGRYWGQSGHALLHCICPLMTQSGHRLSFLRGVGPRSSYRLLGQIVSLTNTSGVIEGGSNGKRGLLHNAFCRV
jgi:hypothetical protein